MTRLIKCLPNLDFLTTYGEKTTPSSNDILYFSDWFDFAHLNKTINEFNLVNAVLTDVESTALPCSLPIYYIPTLDTGPFHWVDYVDQMYLPTCPAPTCCFSFSINKKRPDRYLLLKLVEWFKLQSYTHTWSGEAKIFDCSKIIKEFSSIDQPWLTQEFCNHLLSPVNTIDVHWIPSNDKIILTKNNYATMSTIHNKSVVTLLTESSTEYQQNFVFTEKTLWALLCLNFPIWVGNYDQANQARNMGFDIFEEIINHDYQYKNTLLERCYHAVNDNLALLTDFELAKATQKKYLARLIKNQRYIIDGGWEHWIDCKIEKLPADIKSYIHHKSIKYQR